jgi:CBS domain-containing protein
MSETVAEIMDPDFCHASQGDSVGQLLHELSARGLASVPVLDVSGRPIATATLSELQGCRHVEELTEHPEHAVTSVHHDASIQEAARALAEHKAERLILVDDRGVAVGAVSALDLLRALLGFGVDRSDRSPRTPAPGHWSPSVWFSLDAVGHIPAAPGIIVLAGADQGPHPALSWVEATSNLHERLDEMLRLPQQSTELEALLGVYPRKLVLRVLIIPDGRRRDRVLRALHALMKRVPAPERKPGELRRSQNDAEIKD